MRKRKFLDLKADLIRQGIKICEIASDLELYPSTLSRYLNGWVAMPSDVEQKIRSKIAERNNGGKA